jgi:hypothetical protein
MASNTDHGRRYDFSPEMKAQMYREIADLARYALDRVKEYLESADPDDPAREWCEDFIARYG